MKQAKLGKLPPRYLFALNPYSDYRASSCPHCNQLTYPRKFALLIHVAPDHLIALRKTCKYCPKCEFIIAHQNELEAELTESFMKLAPEDIGNNYLVLGTVELKAWRQGLTEEKPIAEMLAYVADFKDYRQFEYIPAGRYSADDVPPTSERSQSGKRRKNDHEQIQKESLCPQHPTRHITAHPARWLMAKLRFAKSSTGPNNS